MRKSSAVGLNIQVMNDKPRRVLQVNLQAPPVTMSVGSFDNNLTKYIAAVRTRVPDLGT